VVERGGNKDDSRACYVKFSVLPVEHLLTVYDHYGRVCSFAFCATEFIPAYFELIGSPRKISTLILWKKNSFLSILILQKFICNSLFASIKQIILILYPLFACTLIFLLCKLNIFLKW